ncbi:MAG TPA: CHAD domain-containing protein [Thermoleophilaceae bacterium]|jgi:CHAD domain-containing protein
MASRGYKLKAGEAVPRGIARITRGRIDHALDELEGRTDSSPEEAVHEARKDMKKLRAVVRLVRAEIGDHAYRRENECFRDAGQELSGVRDADVMLSTLAKLEGEIPDATAGDLRQALEAHKLRTAGGARQQASAQVVKILTTARRRVGRWPLDEDGFEAVAGGLERIYRRGRKDFRRARAEPTTENLHEWRKRAKDLWYHLTILRTAWPPVMDALADEAHSLSERVGDDHDLAVLLAWAEEHAPASAAAIGAPVERRRAELQAGAFELGARLYADKPGAFMRRLERWWEAPAGVGRPEPAHR